MRVKRVGSTLAMQRCASQLKAAIEGVAPRQAPEPRPVKKRRRSTRTPLLLQQPILGRFERPGQLAQVWLVPVFRKSACEGDRRLSLHRWRLRCRLLGGRSLVAVSAGASLHRADGIWGVTMLGNCFRIELRRLPLALASAGLMLAVLGGSAVAQTVIPSRPETRPPPPPGPPPGPPPFVPAGPPPGGASTQPPAELPAPPAPPPAGIIL